MVTLKLDLNKIYTKEEANTLMDKTIIKSREVKAGDLVYIFMYRCRTYCAYTKSTGDGWVIVRAKVCDGWQKTFDILPEDREKWERTRPGEQQTRKLWAQPRRTGSLFLARTVYWTVMAKVGDKRVTCIN